LALQNNPPNIYHIGMAGYAPKRFSGRADEDIDEFIKDYRLYLTASGIATGNPAGKQRALELFRSSLTGEASDWVESKLIGKKWRLNHVALGNALANMGAVLALNNAGINGAMINAPDGTPPPALPAGATGALVIPAHNVHTDEDWSYAGGCPVDAITPTNAPNGALNNVNPIVLPDINISQVIYWFKRNYPTVVREQQQMILGTLTQGSDSVRDYYRKVDKYATWARLTPREKRQAFIRGLSPENKLELKRLGLDRPLTMDLIELLEQIETEKNDMLFGGNTGPPATQMKPKADVSRITAEDISRIVDSKIQALQQPASDQTPVSQQNVSRADLQAVVKSFQEIMSRASKTLDNSKKSADKRADDNNIRRFLSDLLRKSPNKNPGDGYDYDPVDDLTDSMAGLTLNSVINAVAKRASKKLSSGHKCSKCGRFGHNSRNCSRKKKKKSKKSKKGKVNLATVDSDSDSGTSSNTSSSDSSDSDTSSSDSSDSESDITVNIAKAKKK
jgi:hypothetical protein